MALLNAFSFKTSYFVCMCVGMCMPWVCVGIKVQHVGGVRDLLPPRGPGYWTQVPQSWWASILIHWTILWAQKTELFPILSSFSSPLPFPFFFLNEIGSQVAQAGIKVFLASKSPSTPTERITSFATIPKLLLLLFLSTAADWTLGLMYAG